MVGEHGGMGGPPTPKCYGGQAVEKENGYGRSRPAILPGGSEPAPVPNTFIHGNIFLMFFYLTW